MKATGIVRRIDDLGRVVIPKEIRRTLRIRESDPLEIYTEKDGSVIFRKYAPMGDLQNTAGSLCRALAQTTGSIAAVTDQDSLVALAGYRKGDLLEKPLSPALEKLIQARKPYTWQQGEATPLLRELQELTVRSALPIINQGDLLGSVLLLSTGNMQSEGPAEKALLQMCAIFLGSQVEL